MSDDVEQIRKKSMTAKEKEANGSAKRKDSGSLKKEEAENVDWWIVRVIKVRKDVECISQHLNFFSLALIAVFNVDESHQALHLLLIPATPSLLLFRHIKSNVMSSYYV